MRLGRGRRDEELLLPGKASADDAGMLDQHLRDGIHGDRAGPVTLELRPQDYPGDQHGAGLHHPRRDMRHTPVACEATVLLR